MHFRGKNPALVPSGGPYSLSEHAYLVVISTFQHIFTLDKYSILVDKYFRKMFPLLYRK